jgi:hypothetical protein
MQYFPMSSGFIGGGGMISCEWAAPAPDMKAITSIAEYAFI